MLVDDQSTDGTADVARRAAEEAAAADRLTVLSGAPLPAGWTGKLWAMKQGIDQAATGRTRVICCSPTPTSSTTPDTLTRLVGEGRRAKTLVLTS